MSHWRSGWKFWPDPPKGPVDDAYRQVHWIRPYRPGFPRIAVVALSAMVLTFPTSTAMLLVFAPGVPFLTRLGFFAVVMLVVLGLGILLARTMAAGVYVNDAGLRLVTLRRTLTTSWPTVVDVGVVEAPVGVLSLPAPRVPARMLVVTLRDLGPVQTPVTSIGPDFLGRPEAFAMATEAVERWWRDTSR